MLDREPQITTPPDAPALPAGHGQVKLSGVALTFEGSTQPALNDIDLEIEAGQTVALVGAMGRASRRWCRCCRACTTSAPGRVIDRRRRRARGRVTSLRHEIAIVHDDPFLFSASVHENIAYARPDATREEVERAAAGGAGRRVHRARCPTGYDTLVGERGLTLSGGQRQRIAIARAIVADPRILILDDATSSVDASTEQEIKLALREVMAGRTTFVIAHRLSTIALADEIVVLEDGRVAARRHPRASCWRARRCTARSSRRACPTRCS